MVDLISQYEKIQEEIDQAVINVIRSSAYINGPEVKAFQTELEEYLGVKHVIPCANGTDALQLAMMAAGLKPGDEVITASFTYIATAEVIALLGLTPVLVEVNEDTFTIDIESIKKAITPKTKAIVPVHLFGQCADMDEIMKIAQEHHLIIIEDTAQAIGAEYTHADGSTSKAGTIGHFGCTSFFPSKNLGCFGDGGAIFTNDDSFAAKLRMMANHGQAKQYYHDEIGVNSRLDSIQAAILRIKLRHLDEYARARNKAAERYDSGLVSDNITIPKRARNSTHVFHQYTIKVKQGSRDVIREKLAEVGIPSMIYYPVPIHLQKAYRSNSYPDGAFPITEKLCSTVLSLPMHTEMSETDQKMIIEHVLNIVNEKILSS